MLPQIEWVLNIQNPMAETEIHRDAIIKTLQTLTAYFEDSFEVSF